MVILASIRDKIDPYLDLSYLKKSLWGPAEPVETAIVSEEKQSIKQSIKVISRVAFIVLELEAMCRLSTVIPLVDSVRVSMIVGSLISFPSSIGIFGAVFSYYGVAVIATAVALQSFAGLGVGAIVLSIGWGAIAHHDIIQFGVGEMLLDRAIDLFV
jgi:hypothetical protein